MRVVTESELARHLGAVGGEPRLVASGNFAAPPSLLEVAEGAIERFRLFMLNAQPGVPDRPGIVHETPFVGSGVRHSPRLAYVPARLSLVPRLLAAGYRPDVVLLHATTPRRGHLSLGTEVNILPAAVEACRAGGGLVVAQLNHRMPWTAGDAVLPVEDVDLAIEAEADLACPSVGEPDDDAREAAARVASFVSDGSTLQAGIGAIPDAALAALAGRRGLRVWTEMFSDGLLGLDRAGAIDPGHHITASFCFGSPELYEFLDGNHQVVMTRTERVNDPSVIARQRLMVSINTALEVDLYAQANAHRVGGRIYSGIGGQTDFVVGAMHSAGGQAIIALRSWHAKGGCSTVVPLLSGPVTSFQHSHIVSERGAADIFGCTETEQVDQIVERVAHPRCRDHLREAARSRRGPVGA